MNKEVTTGNAEPESNTAEKTNITAEDFAVQRLGQPTPQPEEPEAPEVEEEVADEIATDEVEGLEESDESTEDETPEAESEEQVLSQIDLDDMSEVERAEDIMFNADGYEADDVVTEVEGKEMTKVDVRNALLQARKARDKFLPDRLQKIQEVEQSKQMQEHLSSQAEAELPWMKGEDNDTRREYEAIMGDSRVETLMKNLPPDVKAQMPYLLAHAANSIYGRKAVKETKSNVRLNPSNTSSPSAASSDKPASRTSKSIKNLNSQFKQSGDKSDFITLRTLQLQNK